MMRSSDTLARTDSENLLQQRQQSALVSKTSTAPHTTCQQRATSYESLLDHEVASIPSGQFYAVSWSSGELYSVCTRVTRT